MINQILWSEVCVFDDDVVAVLDQTGDYALAVRCNQAFGIRCPDRQEEVLFRGLDTALWCLYQTQSPVELGKGGLYKGPPTL